MLLLWRRRIGRSGGCFSFAGVAGCSGGGGGLARGLLLRWLLYGLGRGWVCGGHGVVAQTHGGDGVRGESVGWLLLDGLLLGLLLVVGVLQHGAAGGGACVVACLAGCSSSIVRRVEDGGGWRSGRES